MMTADGTAQMEKDVKELREEMGEDIKKAAAELSANFYQMTAEQRKIICQIAIEFTAGLNRQSGPYDGQSEKMASSAAHTTTPATDSKTLFSESS